MELATDTGRLQDFKYSEIGLCNYDAYRSKHGLLEEFERWE